MAVMVAPLAIGADEGAFMLTVHLPVVLVVVYGNRAYEKALVELDAFASTKLGFKVIAGATFVGEHSYSTVRNIRWHPGRPDADDLEYAKLFGEKIRD